MNYGKAIRTIRATKGWGQKDLADLLGVDKSYLSLLESNKRKPSADFLEKFCKRVKIPPHLFLLLSYEKNELGKLPKNESERLAKDLLQILSELDK